MVTFICLGLNVCKPGGLQCTTFWIGQSRHITMQGSDAPHHELYSIPGPSSDINMQFHLYYWISLLLLDSMQFRVRRRLQYVDAWYISGWLWWKDLQRKEWPQALWVYWGIFSKLKLADCSPIDIDKYKCGKCDKCKASNLEISIVVGLAVNKIVICEWFSLIINLNWNKNKKNNDF